MRKNSFPISWFSARVSACFFCELDTYENLAGTGYLDDSSFDLIEGSNWLESLPVRKDFDKSRFYHYRLFTYDVVYNIIAIEFQLEIDI